MSETQKMLSLFANLGSHKEILQEVKQKQEEDEQKKNDKIQLKKQKREAKYQEKQKLYEEQRQQKLLEKEQRKQKMLEKKQNNNTQKLDNTIKEEKPQKQQQQQQVKKDQKLQQIDEKVENQSDDKKINGTSIKKSVKKSVNSEKIQAKQVQNQKNNNSTDQQIIKSNTSIPKEENNINIKRKASKDLAKQVQEPVKQQQIQKKAQNKDENIQGDQEKIKQNEEINDKKDNNTKIKPVKKVEFEKQENNEQESKNQDIGIKGNIVIKRKKSSCEVLQQVQNGENGEPYKKVKKNKNKPQQKPISSNWLKFQKLKSGQQEVSNQINKSKNKNNNNITTTNNSEFGEFLSLIPDPSSFKGQTPAVAVDCEMVMCEDYEQGQKHLLARVSIVNYNGHVLLDSYVNPQRKVVNYLTWVSGIQAHHIKGAPSLKELKPKIEKILKGKIIVGHTINNDFSAMEYTPQLSKVRDIARYTFLKTENGRLMSLKNMNDLFLNIKIQKGQHSSVEDAQATMLIYRKFEKRIEDVQKKIGYKLIKDQLLNDIQEKEQDQIEEE